MLKRPYIGVSLLLVILRDPTRKGKFLKEKSEGLYTYITSATSPLGGRQSPRIPLRNL